MKRGKVVEPVMKPFIKLIKSPNGYYFFDVNRNMVCSVDEEVYSDLERIERGDKIEESEAIKKLQEEGWLSCNRPNRLIQNYQNEVESRLHHNVNNLILQVTQSCNLTCIYCPYANNTKVEYSRTHTGKRMSYETAQKSVDFLKNNSDNVDKYKIGFYGGEPLIEYDLIKKVHEYAEFVLEGKKVSYNITTNGTLFTDEMIDFFASNGFEITFSLDGPETIHDRHRCKADGSPTYNLVINNLRKVINAYKGKTNLLSINIVINPIMNELDKVVEWLDMPEFREIRIMAGVVENYSLEKKFLPDNGFVNKYNYLKAVELLKILDLIDDNKRSKLFGKSLKNLYDEYGLFQNDLGEIPEETSVPGPCLAGEKKLFVNTEGFFYPCEKVNELSDCMKIGCIEQGFDYKKINEQANISNLTSNECKNCFAINNCCLCQRQADGGDCLSADAKRKYCKESKEEFLGVIKTNILIYECRTKYK